MKVYNIYAFYLNKDFKNTIVKIESKLKNKIFKNEEELKKEK
jgi:hypothetical protein